MSDGRLRRSRLRTPNLSPQCRPPELDRHTASPRAAPPPQSATAKILVAWRRLPKALLGRSWHRGIGLPSSRAGAGAGHPIGRTPSDARVARLSGAPQATSRPTWCPGSGSTTGRARIEHGSTPDRRQVDPEKDLRTTPDGPRRKPDPPRIGPRWAPHRHQVNGSCKDPRIDPGATPGLDRDIGLG